MRKSRTRQRLQAGEPVRICCLGHFIPSYVRHASHFGYDCIWLDLEHRLIGEREVQTLLAHFHLADIDCMLRPPTLEKTRLYRYLEEGATGLMIPHVSTAEKARMLVDAVKFPPLGDRGLDNAGLDADYLLHDRDEYVEHANQETFLVVQIETLAAVRNVDEIASIQGVDGLFVGPGDLGLRLAQSADSQITFESAVAKVAAAASRHGKAWGCPAASTNEVRELRQRGARLIVYGGEFIALMEMLRSCGTELDEIYQEVNNA